METSLANHALYALSLLSLGKYLCNPSGRGQLLACHTLSSLANMDLYPFLVINYDNVYQLLNLKKLGSRSPSGLPKGSCRLLAGPKEQKATCVFSKETINKVRSGPYPYSLKLIKLVSQVPLEQEERRETPRDCPSSVHSLSSSVSISFVLPLDFAMHDSCQSAPGHSPLVINGHWPHNVSPTSHGARIAPGTLPFSQH